MVGYCGRASGSPYGPCGGRAPGSGSDWWQWRGPNRDNTSPETGLALDWTKTPPTELWRVNVGRSIASLVIAGGQVYASGVDLKKGEDSIWALDAETGRAIWRYAFPCDVPAEYGSESPVWYPEWAGTHATPTVCEGRLYAVSQDGRALCLDAATGKLLWSRTGLGRGSWGYNTSPLVIGNMVILESGLTLDKTTGETLWTGLGGDTGGRVASSPVRFAWKGQDCLLVETAGRHFQAYTLADFKPFWNVHSGEAWEPDSDPLVMGDRVLFANGDRPATLAAIGAAKADTRWIAIHNAYDTPILYQGYLYSTSGYLGRDLQCYDAKDGSLKWRTFLQRSPQLQSDIHDPRRWQTDRAALARAGGSGQAFARVLSVIGHVRYSREETGALCRFVLSNAGSFPWPPLLPHALWRCGRPGYSSRSPRAAGAAPHTRWLRAKTAACRPEHGGPRGQRGQARRLGHRDQGGTGTE